MDKPVTLLGPDGTVRDLVAAVLTLQGFAVDAAETADDTDPSTPLVLVAPGVEEWDAARVADCGVFLVAEGHFGDAEQLDAVLRGADAVVHTDASPVELARAVDAVARGETVLDPRQIRRLAAAARSRAAAARTDLTLTTRELEILESVERGESVKQTARTLGIAAKTVENLQSRLFRKLGARNRAHAVTLAHRLGLLAPADAVAS